MVGGWSMMSAPAAYSSSTVSRSVGPDHGEGLRRDALDVLQRLEVAAEAGAEHEHALGALDRAAPAASSSSRCRPRWPRSPGRAAPPPGKWSLSTMRKSFFRPGQLLPDGEAYAAPAEDDVGVMLALRRPGLHLFLLLHRDTLPAPATMEISAGMPFILDHFRR